MKKALKIFGITLGSIVILLVLLIGSALWVVLTPERLTPIVRNVAKGYVKCDHHIGKVELTFFSTFPHFGLSLDSITVVNPKAIEKEARKLKRRLSHSLIPSGDVGRFIALYDSIETRCCALVEPVVLERLRQTKGCRFEYILELLLLQKKLPAPLLLDIRRVHRYYACTVNCSPMTVTREMVELAQKISDTLP